MWLFNSSVGRKFVMSISGAALVFFLLFHASMNLVAIVSEAGYNMICEFLGANWYALVGTAGLAFLVIVHFVYAFVLTAQNYKARGTERYAVVARQKGVDWASKNMLALGIIVILGLGLHLFNFWYNMQYVEIAGIEDKMPFAADGVHHIKAVFSNPCYVVLYLVWLTALWFHLSHGIWSSLQSLGWSNNIWLKRIQVIGTIFATLIVLMFASVVIYYYVASLMCAA